MEARFVPQKNLRAVASPHGSVKKVMNRIEAYNQHAKLFAWTNAEVYRCRAIVRAKMTWPLVIGHSLLASHHALQKKLGSAQYGAATV